MKIGTKVYCKDTSTEYVGYIASIEYVLYRPFNIVKHKEDIGKTFTELCDKYGLNTKEFEIYSLEHLTEYDTYIKEKEK